jgi:hypothetical protein
MISWLIIYYYSFFNYQLSFLFPQNQVPNLLPKLRQDLDLDQLGGWVDLNHLETIEVLKHQFLGYLIFRKNKINGFLFNFWGTLFWEKYKINGFLFNFWGTLFSEKNKITGFLLIFCGTWFSEKTHRKTHVFLILQVF